MEELIDRKAGRLLKRETKTLIKPLGALHAIKPLFTLSDTVCQREAGKLRHALGKTVAEAKS